MRLIGKTLLMLVCDGVDREEVELLHQALEREHAQVLLTSPQDYLMVETISNGRRGADLTVDVTFESVQELKIDAVIIPDGLLSTDGLRHDLRVIEFLHASHKRGIPLFASGNAVQLLYDSKVLSQQVVVREGTPLNVFIDQAVEVLLKFPPRSAVYRSSQLTNQYIH